MRFHSKIEIYGNRRSSEKTGQQRQIEGNG